MPLTYRTRRPIRVPSPAGRLVALVGAGVLLGFGACGHHDDAGSLFLFNGTHLTTDEDVLEFRIAEDDEPLTGTPNRLSEPLPPGDEDYLGDFEEDFYDAQALLEGGQTVDWSNVFIGDRDDTVLEVF